MSGEPAPTALEHPHPTEEAVHALAGRGEHAPVQERAPAPETFRRFSLSERIQHIVLFSSFIVLVVTGFPLKYPDVEIFNGLLVFIGGVKGARILHRVAAVIMILDFLYHNYHVWKLIFQGKIRFKDIFLLVPRPRDVKDLFQNICYFLGLRDRPPRFDKFSYVEKFDYWAVYWGMFIMAGSGLILWFPEFFSQYFKLDIIRIAYIAHSDEALLAFLAITCWHMYNVHLNARHFPMNRVWYTGTLSREEMIREHPLEYERWQEREGKKAERTDA